jgi:hypothetical protein
VRVPRRANVFGNLIRRLNRPDSHWPRVSYLAQTAKPTTVIVDSAECVDGAATTGSFIRV